MKIIEAKKLKNQNSGSPKKKKKRTTRNFARNPKLESIWFPVGRKLQGNCGKLQKYILGRCRVGKKIHLKLNY